MKLLTLLLVSLFITSCATGTAQIGGRSKRPETQLCIINQAGLPVHVYDTTSRMKQGTVPGSRGCVKLRSYVTDQQATSTLCVQSLESNGCVLLPPVVWGNVPTWNLHLGPWANTWYRDVYSLLPAPATD